MPVTCPEPEEQLQPFCPFWLWASPPAVRRSCPADHEEAWPLLAPGRAAPPQSEAEAAALLAAAAPGPALWDALLGLAELYAATHRYAPAAAVLRALRCGRAIANFIYFFVFKF